MRLLLSAISLWHLANFYVLYRTLVFVEGDASINQWEDAEGKSRTTMNIVQRQLHRLRRTLAYFELYTDLFCNIGNLEVLRKPSGSREDGSS